MPLPPAEHRPFYYCSKLFVQDNLTKVTFELAEISSNLVLVWVRLPQLNSVPESCHKTTDLKIPILCYLAACIHLKCRVLLYFCFMANCFKFWNAYFNLSANCYLRTDKDYANIFLPETPSKHFLRLFLRTFTEFFSWQICSVVSTYVFVLIGVQTGLKFHQIVP